MDGETLNQRIYAGRARAAAHIGVECQLYRPIGNDAPLANLLRTLKVSFNAADPKYMKPNLYGKAVWFADLDARFTQPGDYVIRSSDDATWFIAAQQPLLPIVCIECNRKIALQRPAKIDAVGVVGYGGEYPENQEVKFGQAENLWPASVLIGRRTQAATSLPATVKEAVWEILLPSTIWGTIRAADILLDDRKHRYAVQAAELTDLGWRIQAEEAHA